ncbi:MAG: FadR/GntR family transcriptional regulator [Microbacterium sp.]
MAIGISYSGLTAETENRVIQARRLDVDDEVTARALSRTDTSMKQSGGTVIRMSDLSDRWTSRPAGERVGAVAYVLRDISDAITAGVVRVGDRLPSEHALAARYGVSRAVVREVLRVLETRGLTVTRTGRGTFVAKRRPAAPLQFGSYSSADLIEARPHIEIAAAGLAAVRRSEDQLRRLQDLHEQMEAESDPKAWVELDVTLHATIAAASGNPVFADILSRIRDALSHQSAMLNLSPGRRDESDSEHRAVIAGIARGSVAEAEDAMQFHLDQVKEVVLGITTRDDRR